MPSVVVEFGSYPCLDPVQELENCRAWSYPTDWYFAHKPNSFTLPLGREAGRGWVLMNKSNLDLLDREGEHTLRFKLADAKNRAIKQVEIRDLIIASEPRCITPGRSGDAAAAYLVEIADKRHLAYWRDCNRQFNVYMPGVYDNARILYARDTLKNNTDIWTWQQIVDQLWTDVSVLDGVSTLPYTPDGTPQNFQYVGTSAWFALCDVLDRIGCAVYRTLAGVWSIARIGGADAGNDTIASLNAADRIFNEETLSQTRGRIPKQVKVYFRKVAKHRGTELQLNDVGKQFITNSVYTKVITGETLGYETDDSETGSTAIQWSDFAVQVDAGGASVASDTTTADTIAEDIADTYYKRITNASRQLRIYRGPVAFIPGPKISAVHWSNSTGDIQTETIREPLRVSAVGVGDGGSSDPFAVNRMPPDFARATAPNYPDLVQLIEHSGALPNSDGLSVGTLSYVNPDTAPFSLQSRTETVWFKETNALHGRMNGVATSSGTTRPMYTVPPTQGWFVQVGYGTGGGVNSALAYNYQYSGTQIDCTYNWKTEANPYVFDTNTWVPAILKQWNSGVPEFDIAPWPGLYVELEVTATGSSVMGDQGYCRTLTFHGAPGERGFFKAGDNEIDVRALTKITQTSDPSMPTTDNPELLYVYEIVAHNSDDVEWSVVAYQTQYHLQATTLGLVNVTSGGNRGYLSDVVATNGGISITVVGGQLTFQADTSTAADWSFTNGIILPNAASPSNTNGALYGSTSSLLYKDPGDSTVKKVALFTNTTIALGDTLYASSAYGYGVLAGNTTTTKKYLTQTGDGVASAAPAWEALAAGDLPNHASRHAAGGADEILSLASTIGIGGTAVTDPGLRKSSAMLEVVLADGSDYAVLRAKSLGLGRTPGATALIDVDQTSTSTSGTVLGQQIVATHNPSAASSATYIGISNTSRTNSANAQNLTGTIFGLSNASEHHGSGTVSNLIGVRGVCDNRSSGGVTTIKALNGFVRSLGSGTITSGSGLFIESPTISGGGAITTLYGIHVANQTGGGTNYAIYTGTGQVRLGDDVVIVGKLCLTRSALTIASGAITKTKSIHTVDTEAAAATDDLDTINGGADGDLLVLRAANSARTVVCKDGTGNLKLAGDFSLDNTEDTITLLFDGTNWHELSRSDNGA